MKSYFNNKNDNMTLIINPDYSDIKELNVNFRYWVQGKKIVDAHLLYLAQVESVDYADTLTYILYEKDGDLIIFSERYDQDLPGYEIFNEKHTKEEYFDILRHFENDYENTFFQDSFKEYEYRVLDNAVSIKEENKAKKIKV